ncbi:MAG: hypothetical protein K2Q23_18050 [Bryobacteraceae bacterium]|nr:hypothetical protein [Bryobacteraceae bacterium]
MRLLILTMCASVVLAAAPRTPVCVGSTALGSFRLLVKPANGKPSLPLRQVNRIAAGDQITKRRRAAAGLFDNAGVIVRGGGGLSGLKGFLMPDTESRGVFAQPDVADGVTFVPVRLEARAAAGRENQTIRTSLSWPPPSPRAPLYVWLRGDTEGRLTKLKP